MKNWMKKLKKEQLTYMAMGNTKADSFMEIDYESLDGIMDDNSCDNLIYPSS